MVDGVRVGCASPEQPGPFTGKTGELKRWRQFLIRGDPTFGGHKRELIYKGRRCTWLKLTFAF